MPHDDYHIVIDSWRPDALLNAALLAELILI